MKLSEIEGAARGNPALRRMLQLIEQWGTGVEKHIGHDPLAAGQSGDRRVAPPPLADMSVTGVDGHYLIEILNPPGAIGLLHEVKGATSVPIGKSNDIIQKGPGVALLLDILDPGTTRYWQLRSKYLHSDFNQPQVFPAVASGLLSSQSLSPLASPANPQGSSPLLVQATTDAVITVVQSVFNFGALEVTYNAGTITQDSDGNPLTYAEYHVYADDPNKQGGNVVYIATTSISDLTASDARVYFGTIVLTEIGGAMGTGAGSGPCPAAGEMITMADDSQRPIETLVAGDVIKGIDGDEEIISIEALNNIPCFVITTNGGRTAIVSSDHPVMLSAGNFQRALALQVDTRINTVDGDDFVTTKSFVGLRTVYRIKLSRNRLYLVGGIWGHNKDEFSFIPAGPDVF